MRKSIVLLIAGLAVQACGSGKQDEAEVPAPQPETQAEQTPADADQLILEQAITDGEGSPTAETTMPILPPEQAKDAPAER
jgi:hypothetical protein